MRFISASILALLISFAGAAAPEWTRNGVKREGNTVTVVCSSESASKDIAWKLAIKNCTSLAASQVNSTISIESVTIQTEKETALHDEIRSSQDLTGLLCNPIDEYSEARDGATTLWLKCRFDLSLVTAHTSLPQDKISTDSEDKVVTFQEKANPPTGSEPIEKGAYLTSDKHILSISIIPRCESILITGMSSRVIRCGSNPITFSIEPGDKELIIRSHDFKPKTIPLASSLLNKTTEQTYEVILDR